MVAAHSRPGAGPHHEGPHTTTPKARPPPYYMVSAAAWPARVSKPKRTTVLTFEFAAHRISDRPRQRNKDI